MKNFYFFQHNSKAIYVRLAGPDEFISFLYAVRNVSGLNDFKDGNYTIDKQLCTVIDMNKVNQSNLLEFVIDAV